MAVPKKKISKARTGSRRAHEALPVRGTSDCPKCGEPRLPHRACLMCGYYKGRVVKVVATGTEEG